MGTSSSKIQSAVEEAIIATMLLIFGCISWALGTLYAKYRSSREEEVNNFAGSACVPTSAAGRTFKSQTYAEYASKEPKEIK